MKQKKAMYFCALLVLFSFICFSFASSLFLQKAVAREVIPNSTYTPHEVAAYIHAKAYFVTSIQFTAYEIGDFLKNFYDREHYDIDKRDVYVLDKSNETILVSCEISNAQSKHIQYIKATSPKETGCPVFHHKEALKEIANYSGAKSNKNSFVEVSVIHI